MLKSDLLERLSRIKMVASELHEQTEHFQAASRRPGARFDDNLMEGVENVTRELCEALAECGVLSKMEAADMSVQAQQTALTNDLKRLLNEVVSLRDQLYVLRTARP